MVDERVEDRKMQAEWKKWQLLIDAMCAAFNVDREEINKKEYEPMFKAIRNWGDSLVALRRYQDFG